MGDEMEPEFKELWEEFKSQGGTRRDWDNLILKPEWPDVAVSWISTDDPDHGTKLKEVMTQFVQPGDMIEFVVRNQKGAVTGEALGRVQNVRSSKGHYSVKFYHLATTDENYHEWAKEHLNQAEDFEMHFCKVNVSSCQIKPFLKRTAFFHVDTFRLIPFWMGIRLGYAKEAVVAELGSLVKAWVDQENLGLEDPGEGQAAAAGEGAAVAEGGEGTGVPPGWWKTLGSADSPQRKGPEWWPPPPLQRQVHQPESQWVRDLWLRRIVMLSPTRLLQARPLVGNHLRW